MSKLVWDVLADREFETGVDHGVLYPQVSGAYPKGVAWNGITTVTESPSGAEASDQYADNIKYLSLMSEETFSGTIEAFMYPDEFAACNGEKAVMKGVYIGQQARQGFGLATRTIKGNAADGEDYGYKLHLYYGLKASPSQRSYTTKNDSPSPLTFSWSVNSTPVNVTGYKPTATLTIDSTEYEESKLKALEDVLYGSDSAEARLPMPDEVFTLLGKTA